MSDNVAIGWDDDISGMTVEREQEDFVVLPPGKYPFRVAKVERAQFNGSQKLPACGMVKVGIVAKSDKGNSYVNTNFYMVKSILWKIFEFLTSVGLHKKGQVVSTVPWGKVDTDCEGMVELGIRKYTDKYGVEQTSNEVKKWLSPTESAPAEDEDEY